MTRQKESPASTSKSIVRASLGEVETGERVRSNQTQAAPAAPGRRAMPQGPGAAGGPAAAAGMGGGPVEKVGRNDPCPCGSGKKYKKCHGA